MRRQLGLFSVTFAALVTALVATARFQQKQSQVTLALPLESIPTEIDGWHGTGGRAPSAEVVRQLKATSYLLRAYRREGRTLGLFIAFYSNQRAGENMHSPKNCIPGNGWVIWDQATVLVPVNRRSVRVNKYLVQYGSDRALLLYWYQSRRRIVASELAGKLFLFRDAIIDGSTADSLVRLTLPDTPGSLEAGVSFASALVPEVQRCLVR